LPLFHFSSLHTVLGCVRCDGGATHTDTFFSQPCAPPEAPAPTPAPTPRPAF
jgi:hypothetical protein